MHTDNRAPEERLEWHPDERPGQIDEPVWQKGRDAQEKDVIEQIVRVMRHFFAPLRHFFRHQTFCKRLTDDFGHEITSEQDYF